MHSIQLAAVGLCGAFAVSGDRAVAQAVIPIRHLAPPSATSTVSVRSLAGVRHLIGGRVLVNDLLGRRLFVFDSTLTSVKILMDSAGGDVPRYLLGSRALVSYRADSTLFYDPESKVFVVIDPAGNLGRAVALPKGQDAAALTNAAVDARGNLVYGVASTKDSGAIVRASFDTHQVDTIGKLRIASGPPRVVFDSTSGGKLAGVLRIDPSSPQVDGWTVTSDGVVAIVRGHDYSVDWYSVDGTKKTSPKLAFDWRRITDEEKQARIDSMRHVIDSLATTAHPYGWTIRATTPTHYDTIIPRLEFTPISQMPDYLAPIRGGAVKADADGNVWILPTTSAGAVGGLLYDVVSPTAGMFERVQLPPDRSIAGFGRGGIIYIMHGDFTHGYLLERTTVVR